MRSIFQTVGGKGFKTRNTWSDKDANATGCIVGKKLQCKKIVISALDSNNHVSSLLLKHDP